MELLLNPVVLAVLLMLLLALLRVHVVFSLIVSALAGGLVAKIPADQIRAGLKLADDAPLDGLSQLKYTIHVFEEGITAGTTTALSYAVLGAFAVAISYSGLSQLLANAIIRRVQSGARGTVKVLLLGALLLAGVLSQNLIPVHIAFIPILLPPLFTVMNRLQLDRRAVACVLTFGLVCTYMFIPYGFGDIFIRQILLGNIERFGMDVAAVNTYKALALPALGMAVGLAVALFYSYRRPRVYADRPVEGAEQQLTVEKGKVWVAALAVLLAFLAQKYTGSLIFAGLVGFAIFMAGRVIRWQQADTVFNNGIRMMSMVGFILISANGFAAVMHASHGIEPLVQQTLTTFGASKSILALAMLLLGLLITMGIGSSFSTLPIIAAVYVPLCAQIGFSPTATVALIGTAGVLGDAGSPTSDSALGPTMGLNADGQHDHIRDTVIPTFLHYNLPLVLFGWLAALIL